MARQPGAKNKTRIEMTLSPWYGEKIKELRVDSGFESDQAFCRLGATLCRFCAVSVSQTIKSLVTATLRMEQALPCPLKVTHE